MENDFQKRVWTLKGEKSHGVKSQPCLLWSNRHKSLVVFPIKCFGLKFAWRFYSTQKELSCDAGPKDYFLSRGAILNFPEGGQRIFSRLKSYLTVPKRTEKHCSAQRLIANLKFEVGANVPPSDTRGWDAFSSSFFLTDWTWTWPRTNACNSSATHRRSVTRYFSCWCRARWQCLSLTALSTTSWWASWGLINVRGTDWGGGDGWLWIGAARALDEGTFEDWLKMISLF